jgi:hypothetical protein
MRREGGRGREEKKIKNNPDHNMSCRFLKNDRKAGGLGMAKPRVNFEAELGRNSRDEPACLMDWLAQPMRRRGEKRHQDPTRTALSETFAAAGQAGYLVNRVH